MNLNFQRCFLTLAVILIVGSNPLVAEEIHDAAEFGNLERVKQMLAADPSLLNTQDEQGRTLLCRAALSGKPEIVKFLVASGAEEDIFAASILGDKERVAAVLDRESQGAPTPSRCGRLVSIRSTPPNATLVNSKDRCGKCPIHRAAIYGQEAIAKILLDRGADVHARDGEGFTALHWTVMFDRQAVASLLLARKPDVNAKVPIQEWTPMRLAVLHDRREMAKLLLANGADVNARDSFESSLLHEAVVNGRKEMVDLLLVHKAHVNAKDSNGDTPLLLAREKGFEDIAAILLAHGGKE
jgi:ankyrin repeat protein